MCLVEKNYRSYVWLVILLHNYQGMPKTLKRVGEIFNT
uniref:Uncharacterized protein n=1 Tax=Sphingobacterium sp. (strain 21) TaxID=743722 RepID=F4C9X9_SPHS2